MTLPIGYSVPPSYVTNPPALVRPVVKMKQHQATMNNPQMRTFKEAWIKKNSEPMISLRENFQKGLKNLGSQLNLERPKPYVVNGEVLGSQSQRGNKSQEHSEVVILRDGNTADSNFCSGAFIDDKTLLTAAHCTMKAEEGSKELKNIEQLFVAKLVPEEQGYDRFKLLTPSQSIVRHPNWAKEKNPVNPYDLAIVRFPRGTGKKGSSIGPQSPASGDKVTLIGYGFDHIPSRSNKPNYSSLGMKRKGFNTVADTKKGLISIETNKKEIALNAGPTPGDSGGPLYDSNNQIIGVVSGGKGEISYYVDLNSEISKKFLEENGL